MGPDTGDRCREARDLEVEEEACLDLFFLCFFDLPEWLYDDLDLGIEHPWERLFDRSQEYLWDLDRDRE